MKIVHCIYSFNVGGAETMLVDIVNEQVASHDVTLIIVNDSYSQILLDQIDRRVSIIRIKRKAGSLNPWSFIHLNYILYTGKYDIIHLHSPSLSRVLLGTMKSKIVYTTHCLGVDIKDILRGGHVFAISESVRNDLLVRGQGIINADRIVVVPNGVRFDAIRSRIEYRSSHRFSIINVARLDSELKGQDILIRAIALLKNRGIEHLCVDFIGEGRSRELLENLSEDLDVSEQVRFLGLKDREYIYQHLCEYDLMCHPSRFEGFGLTVAEGMAAKLPVLVATGDGPYEIIGQGKYGFSFENGSVESCADMLQYIVEHYDEALQKVEQSYEHIETNYSLRKMVAEYFEEYQNALIDCDQKKEI
ncbi:glycosyltransferase [Porphyromonas gingivalis]|uniref:Glycosyltransferase n=1 Tax=Porphyromonas gingivalis TaxID=837 RepID=A0AAE9XIP2_PORGN|nr:glycosyltransferase [Porphyromonas gingivalis]WCG02994.1 glycosyltransferase [Porphyromonas gingivalis]SJL29870.1 glycosyl transferase [Porphyromonas gingivalis]